MNPLLPKPISLLLCLAFFTVSGWAQSIDSVVVMSSHRYVYKTIDTVSLELEVYQPEGRVEGRALPAIIFFFGGSWKGGTTEQFRPQAQYFASRGMVAVLADYRVKGRQGTTPFDAVADAKSAIRYLRQHAAELGIDPEKIVGSGGSAGGHLAAATATLPGLDAASDDLTVSCQPNALVLFNPVFDNGPEGFGFEACGGEARYREISPLHNLRSGTPPAIVFLGTEDQLIPVATAEAYRAQMEAVGSRCELRLYEGQGHGFFNHKHKAYYLATVVSADLFLHSLGYLTGDPDLIFLNGQ